MREKPRFGHVRIFVFITAMSSVISCGDLAARQLDEARQSFDVGISALQQSRPRDSKSVSATDTLANDLLERFSDPQEQSLIYYSWSHAYAQSGVKDPAKVIRFARQSLKKQKNESLRLKAYVYIGDAEQIYQGRAPGLSRSAALNAYIQGLSELLQRHPLPDEPPPVPIAVLHSLDPASPGFAGAEKERLESIAAQSEARLIGELVNYRDVLERQIVDMYRRQPYDVSELKTAAEKSGLNPRVTERLTKRAEATASQSMSRNTNPQVEVASSWKLVLVIVNIVLILALGAYFYFRQLRSS